MASIQAFCTVLMFMGVMLSVGSLSTGYWRVFYSISHQHSNPSEHHDLTRLLYDGLPFTNLHKYKNVTGFPVLFSFHITALKAMRAYVASGFSLSGTIMGCLCFITEVVQIFFIPPNESGFNFIQLEIIFGFISALLEFVAVVVFSVSFFRNDSIAHEKIEDRFQSVQGWWSLSLKEAWNGDTVKWFVRPGYSFWMMLASAVLLLIVSFSRLALLYHDKKHFKEHQPCIDHGHEHDHEENMDLEPKQIHDHHICSSV